MNTTGIVAFAFGRPGTIASNSIIAEAAMAASLDGSPIFSQPDIVISDRDVEYIDEPDGPSPTLRISRLATEWAIRRGLVHVVAIAATPHLPRCLRDLDVARKEAAADFTISPIRFSAFLDRAWFCSDSSVYRSRIRWLFLLREFILNNAPITLYKQIAS